MKRLFVLALLCATPSLFSVSAETGGAVTNVVKAVPYPPTSNPPVAPAYSPADVFKRVSYTNDVGIITRVIYVKEEVAVYLPPSNTVMKVIYKDKLTHEPLMTVQVTTPRKEAFVSWEIAEE